MTEQAWRIICHGCKQTADGYAPTREWALVDIETWKSEHRLRPGCSMGPFSHSVSPRRHAHNTGTRSDET